MTRLIVGLGQSYRGDDAVGLLVVEELVRAGLPGDIEVQLAASPADLPDLWAGRGLVIVVDAVRSAGRPGECLVIDVADDSLPVGPASAGTHGFGLAEAVELSRVTGRLPANLTVVGVVGAEWTVGADPSAAVAAAVPDAARAVRSLIS